jgi:hypothetical protein
MPSFGPEEFGVAKPVGNRVSSDRLAIVEPGAAVVIDTKHASDAEEKVGRLLRRLIDEHDPARFDAKVSGSVYPWVYQQVRDRYDSIGQTLRSHSLTLDMP